MKLLLTGAKGMLGREILRRFASSYICQGVDIDDFDIRDDDDVQTAFASFHPDVVIHCAAMSKVDACETENEAAFAINALGCANVAKASFRVGARLVALSTDYVFFGDLERPYHEWDVSRPKNVYGESKLAGERAIREHNPNHLILRTGWLYGPGGPSFPHAILAMARQSIANKGRGRPNRQSDVLPCLDRFIDRAFAVVRL